MKELISNAVVCLLLAFQVAAQLPKNSLKELHLKGKVKTVVEVAYLTEEKSGKVQIGEIIENPTICYFKENGNLILKEWPTCEMEATDQKPELRWSRLALPHYNSSFEKVGEYIASYIYIDVYQKYEY